jgi:hypothetical protein
MADWDRNVYYSPSASGLETVGEIEWSDGFYQFDLTVLWRDEAGALHWGEDAGCSCPSPFEDVNSVSELSTGTKWEFVKHVQDRLALAEASEYSKPWDDTRAQVADLIARAMG